MTDSFTHCLRSAGREHAAARLLAGLRVLLLALVLLPIPWTVAHAQDADGSEVKQLRLERSADGLLLYANVRLELPAAVQDALTKGIPMVFLAEADLVRRRWYWTDKKVASAQRHMRLSYHPLTQRWRLNVASGPITPNSLGLALNLNFESLQDAMATMQRISGWRIADAAQIEAESTLTVEFRFGLDMSQLPRPFQISALGQSDWRVGVSATQQIGPEGGR